MTCPHPQRQQDEWFCARCERRWPAGARTEGCPGGLFSGALDAPAAPCADEFKLALAQAIAGPRLDIWIGRRKLLEVRRHKWEKMLTRGERDDAMRAAQAVLDEFRRAPPEVLAAYLGKAGGAA